MISGIHLRDEQRESSGIVPLIVSKVETSTTVNVLRCSTHHLRGKKRREHFPYVTRKGRTYLPDEDVQEAASLGKAIERWLDDGGTAPPSLDATAVLKAERRLL